MSSKFTYERLDKTQAMLIVVDQQEGLYQLTRDRDSVHYKNDVFAHAALGQVFSLPTVITSSEDTGTNGPIPAEVLAMHPTAPFVKRQGEVNAWDNADLRKAVEATGRKQVIIAGITTDVCIAFLALSLRDAGYSVWHNADASGTFDVRTANDANDRMRAAGVHVLSSFAMACELMRDWRATPGAKEMMPFFDKYLPSYGFLARAHDAALKDGTPSGLPTTA
ncbi:Isochorismatase hydrolase [Peniophora sp. CONT]|nr:Isochorismatase hydrolase [Peniophora sp. CONT]